MPPKSRTVYPKKRRSYKKKASTSMNTAALTKLIKNVTMVQSETKYISKNLAFSAMDHNKIYQAHIWGQTGAAALMGAMPFQGPGDDERNGDRITIKGFMLRAVFDIPHDRRETQIAVYFVPHNSGQGDPSDRAQLFHNITGSTISDPIQKKRWTGITKIGQFRLRASDNSMYAQSTAGNYSINTKTIHINKWIPYNTKAYFVADNSIVCSNLREYGTLCFCPYATRNTLETDNITLTGEVNVTTYYKDL